MRRIVLAFMSTVAAVALLFGYRTSTGHFATATSPAVAGGSSNPGSAGSATGTSGSSSGTGSGGSAGSGGSTGTSSTSTRTYTGSVADTRWGPVQVQVTVSGGKVTAASAVEVPNGNPRDYEINSYAVPILDREVVSAQSANINAVSGATVTSDGYIQSLQAALDAAGVH